MNIEQSRELISEQVERQMEVRPMRAMADAADRTISAGSVTGACQTFEEAMSKEGLTLICQVFEPGASAAPKDMDAETLIDLGYEYDAGDADIVAFVQNPADFAGSLELFKELRDEVSTPILRRDLIVHPYQMVEDKVYGADAITLSVDAMSDEELGKFLQVCENLHIAAVVEASDMEGLKRAVDSMTKYVCADFGPEVASFSEMRGAVPEDVFLIAGQGIDSVEDAFSARDAGIDAAIVGDFLYDCYKEDTMRDAIRSMKD